MRSEARIVQSFGFLWLLVACFVLANSVSADQLVTTQKEFFDTTEKLKPGDTIVLANGIWNDFEILFEGVGRPDAPITLTAQTKGEVIISGRSNLRIAGEHLIVSGLVFRDGHTPTNTVISFRRTKGQLANHSRITEVVIDDFNNPERHETDFWVMMYGKHNRFDHNFLAWKRNKGVTMAVRLDSEESRENYHRIDHNYFGPRPILGSNGGETLRIGTSHYSLTDSFTTVESNYFEQCNGEIEIVSSKSGGNRFVGNVFYQSQGTLTLRHGNNNVIESNVFLGNQVPHTGGIRVINKRQLVRNNYLYGLTGHRFGGALVIMNGVPNSPINRYHQVEESVIESNSVIDSDHVEFAAGSDAERSAPPISTTFHKNLIYHSTETDVIAIHDDVSGIDFSNNVTNLPLSPALGDGLRQQSIELSESTNGLLYPSDSELANIGAPRSLQILRKEDTGPAWYPKHPSRVSFDTGRVIEVRPSENALSLAYAESQSGDMLVLQDGQYTVARTIPVNTTLTIRAKQNASPRISFERNSLFEIQDGGNLKLSGLTISGSSSPDMAGNSLIRTVRQSMLSNYELVIEDTTIGDLDTNHSFNVLSLAKHTFARRVAILNSSFENITGHVLQMNEENDDLGIYNVEYLTIADSHFKNIGGTVANIYRGGTDESTFGPHVEIRNVTLDSVGHSKRNKTKASVNLHGVQDTAIFENEFIDSQPLQVLQTVGDPILRHFANAYTNTPEPVVRTWERN